MPEVSDDILEARNFINVKITYDYEKDEVIVFSEFDEPENTIKLIQLGLEKFIIETTKNFKCPHCDSGVKAKWFHCPECGGEL